jgi:hypothetical protein
MESTHQFIRRIKTTVIIFAIGIGICFTNESLAQLTKHALFLGNSYTYYNDLPGLTANIALSAGDTLIAFSSTPGGYTLANHLNNMTSMSYVSAGQWDFVVLQEQSQMPAFPISQVEVETFPFATQLNDSILAHSPCAETVFYMTWGRENGDQQNCANWPPVCTYEGMDDLLHERYMMMAEMNQGVVSPVGAVWRYLRENHPDIDLFSSDGSHPSTAGSYAAALCFYTAFFRKSPLETSFDFTTDNAEEATLRQVVHDLVFLQLSQWYIGAWDPVAAASISLQGINAHAILNESSFADEVYYSIDNAEAQPWTQDSLLVDALNEGAHTVEIFAGKCGVWDTTEIIFDIVSDIPILQNKSDLWVYPNPASDVLQINLPATIQHAQLSLIDSKGVTIELTTTQNGEITSIDCSILPRGLYLLRITQETNNCYLRVILK